MNALKPARLIQAVVVLAALSFVVRLANVVTSDSLNTDTPVGIILQAGAKQEEKADTAPQPPAEEKDAAGQPPADSKTEDAAGDKTGNKAFQRNFSQAEIELLQSLAKRREELAKREQALASKEALLSAAEEEVARKITELKELRQKMEELLNQQQQLEEERLASLVKVYENMKPKDAASIFNTMEMDILIQVMARMSERKMAPILAAMQEKRAQELTIKLAEEHQLPKLPE